MTTAWVRTSGSNMRRARIAVDGPDAAVAAELSVAARAVVKALQLVEVHHKSLSGNYDARRASARVRRDLEQCLDSIRRVRPIGTVTDDSPGTPTPPVRPPVPPEVVE
jgi:hypothetical protein